MKRKPNSLSDFINEQLPLIDQQFTADRKPLPMRPLAAAQFIVERCIEEIQGDTKDDYLNRPWFASLYRLITEWYEARYADAMKTQMARSVRGVVLLYRFPFEVKIPLSLTHIAEVGKTAWLYMPNNVLDQESVLHWLVKGPNLGQLSKEQLTSLENDITTIGTHSRTIWRNLSAATLEQQQLQILSGGIQTALETSVGHILSQANSRILSSFWEIHLAVEKTLKLLIQQHGRTPKKTHDLMTLCSTANETDMPTIDTTLLDKLPPHDEVIKMRYGEGKLKNVQEAVSNYRRGLSILTTLTGRLKARSRINNARFLIRKLPFV